MDLSLSGAIDNILFALVDDYVGPTSSCGSRDALVKKARKKIESLLSPTPLNYNSLNDTKLRASSIDQDSYLHVIDRLKNKTGRDYSLAMVLQLVEEHC